MTRIFRDGPYNVHEGRGSSPVKFGTETSEKQAETREKRAGMNSGQQTGNFWAEGED